MSDQTTDHLSGAVTAVARHRFEWGFRNPDGEEWDDLSPSKKEEHCREAVPSVEAAEPFFATYYEDKGRSEERERAKAVVTSSVKETLSVHADWRDGEGTAIYGNHAEAEELIARVLASLDSDQEGS